MLDFNINLREDFNANQNILYPYLYKLNQIIKYDNINLDELDDGVVLFLFYMVRFYRNVLREKLGNIQNILDKLKVKNEDILINLKIKIYNNTIFMGPNYNILQLCNNLEYGMPGIVNGIPVTNIFTKVNDHIQKEYIPTLKLFNNYIK